MKLLACISFSPAGEHALRFAIQMAAQLEAELHVLHVYPQKANRRDYLPTELQEALKYQGEFTAQRFFLNHLKHLRANLQEVVSLHPHLLEGQLERRIPALATALMADLIIMGVAEKSRLSRPWKGGLAAELIRDAQVPVLLVPDKVDWHPLEHLVYGTRFDEFKRRVPALLEQMARITAAHISCVHITTPEATGRKFLEPMLNRIYRADLNPSYQVCFFSLFHKNAELGLKAFATLYPSQLLALLTLPKRGLPKMFHRSLARRLLFDSPRPLLVIPAADKLSGATAVTNPDLSET